GSDLDRYHSPRGHAALELFEPVDHDDDLIVGLRPLGRGLDHYEALAVGGDRIVGSGTGLTLVPSFEQRLRRAIGERGLGGNVHGHGLVAAAVEELLAVASPHHPFAALR